jgi:ribose transport system substrate-binding protein
MAKLLDGQGEVIMLCHPARENKATRDRELALVEGLKQYALEAKLVSAEQCGGATIDTDYPAAKKLLEQFPDVDGAYAVSGTGIIGFMMALKELDKAGQVKLIGWDAGPDAVQGLRDGIVHAIVQQNPEKMGYGGVKAVVAAIKGEEVKRMVDTGVAIVTKENMDDPEIKQLIEPDFGDWIQ